MKQLLFAVFLCAFMLAIYHSHQPSTDSPPFSVSPIVVNQSLSRRLGKELSFLESKPSEEQKAKMPHGMKKSEAKEGSTGGEHNGDDEGGLVYSADYHAVITHPSPLPKHPRP